MLRVARKRHRLTIRAALILLAAAILPHPASADFLQQGPKLVGSGATGLAGQGNSVAVSADGNTAIVGGPYDATNIGAAWVFVRSNGAWTQEGGKLVGTGAVGEARQGSAVAISADGNTAIIGGGADDNFAGAAWVFVRSNGAWAQQGGKLVGTGVVGTAFFGGAVALSADGNTALIGGASDNSGAGAAWVFTRSGGNWTQQGSKLVGAGAVGEAYQGYGVALSGDGNTALIGAPYDNSAGASWVFTRSAGTWSQFGTKLVSTDPGGVSDYGFSVALSADGRTAAVGGSGAAVVFAFSGTSWNQKGGKLVGTGSTGELSLGTSAASVSLSGDGDTLLSGGQSDADGVGATWVFSRSGGAWAQYGSKIVGSSANGQSAQGISVSLSADGSTAIIGGFADSSEIGASWAWVRRPPHDFSGDTNSDILWRNTSGEAGMWLMKGSTLASAPSLGVVSNNWSIVGQRDFDGDGKSDLLWLNTAGDVGIWFMNGGTILSTAGLGNVGTTWSVVGTGDFDGDGKADILWRNTAGDIGIWFMNSGTILSTAGLGNVGSTWSVSGLGDFNGDGKADILWRSTSHDIGIWFMNGGTLVSTSGLGNVGSTWSVSGLGDFNGDGKGDILWRSTSHDVGLWLMKGGTVVSTPSLGNVGASWNVASVGDYSGDGKADILWRSTSHDIGIWFMTGGALASTAPLGNVGPTWLIQNAASN